MKKMLFIGFSPTVPFLCKCVELHNRTWLEEENTRKDLKSKCLSTWACPPPLFAALALWVELYLLGKGPYLHVV